MGTPKIETGGIKKKESGRARETAAEPSALEANFIQNIINEDFRRKPGKENSNVKKVYIVWQQ